MDLQAAKKRWSSVKKVMDQKLFRKKFLLHFIGNSYVVFPFAAGISIAFASWVLNLEPGILYAFASAVLGICVPIGAIITKWAAGTDDIAKQVHEELLNEVNQRQEEELNVLHHQLAADGDARTETMLQDLRALHQSFQEEARGGAWMGTLPLAVSAEITDKVSQLFTQAVQCLKDTLKMHEKARDAQLGATVKNVLARHREQQIADVQQTILQLSELYARVLTLGPESNETELSRLRAELDKSLAFAKRVDEQIRSLTPDASGSDLDA